MGTVNKIVLSLLLLLSLSIITTADSSLLNSESSTPSFSLFYFKGFSSKLIINNIFSSTIAIKGIFYFFRSSIGNSSSWPTAGGI